MSSFPFPLFRLEVRKDGTAVNPQQGQQIVKAVGTGNIADLIVISHGWNNDEADAQALYDNFFAQVASMLEKHPELKVDGDRIGVVAVFWPSKKFADRDLIPGNAASAGNLDDAADGAIDESLDTLGELLDDPGASAVIEAARTQRNQLDNPSVQNDWFTSLKSVLPQPGSGDDDHVEGAEDVLTKQGSELFEMLNRPIFETQPRGTDEGGATSFDASARSLADEGEGEAAGLGDVLTGIKGVSLVQDSKMDN